MMGLWRLEVAWVLMAHFEDLELRTVYIYALPRILTMMLLRDPGTMLNRLLELNVRRYGILRGRGSFCRRVLSSSSTVRHNIAIRLSTFNMQEKG